MLSAWVFNCLTEASLYVHVHLTSHVMKVNIFNISVCSFIVHFNLTHLGHFCSKFNVWQLVIVTVLYKERYCFLSESICKTWITAKWDMIFIYITFGRSWVQIWAQRPAALTGFLWFSSVLPYECKDSTLN